MTDLALPIPAHLRRGTLRNDEAASVESGVHLLSLMTRRLGFEDLGDVELLDVGCGSKFTQALLTHEIPIGRYLGIDVSRELIEFLHDNVSDPRFEYHHVDLHNEMYNPSGQKLTSEMKLPVADRSVDVVSLFSVLTHSSPEDFENLLRALRRTVRDDGWLYFTAFVGQFQKVPFRDAVRGKPLLWAYYREDFARELVERAGWVVAETALRLEGPQSHFTCRPA